jgi:hypothetical protein
MLTLFDKLKMMGYNIRLCIYWGLQYAKLLKGQEHSEQAGGG